jgi:hypothetical protein
VAYFRSQFTTAKKSLRAAPPRSEFIDTYQPRLLGTGPDSTVHMLLDDARAAADLTNAAGDNPFALVADRVSGREEG